MPKKKATAPSPPASPPPKKKSKANAPVHVAKGVAYTHAQLMDMDIQEFSKLITRQDNCRFFVDKSHFKIPFGSNLVCYIFVVMFNVLTGDIVSWMV